MSITVLSASSVQLDGTKTEINNFLSGLSGATLTYDAADDPSGSVLLTLLVDDRGNVGTGGVLSDSASVSVNVTAENDAPVATVPGADYATDENTTLDLHGTGLAISDVDDGGLAMRATVTVAEETFGAGYASSGSEDRGRVGCLPALHARW